MQCVALVPPSSVVHPWHALGLGRPLPARAHVPALAVPSSCAPPPARGGAHLHQLKAALPQVGQLRLQTARGSRAGLCPRPRAYSLELAHALTSTSSCAPWLVLCLVLRASTSSSPSPVY
ncbi:hypothetical protein Salat_1486200 [Sesamum alatum]|uniref:Uncharacterized protein n=1 Tax=Sesamum alatum TaxID=300844 RepID=A0AAE2CM36_9LAMI|nr:hypothetical protein Salat_1486200 [Sesamum alatum]